MSNKVIYSFVFCPLQIHTRA